MGCMFVFVYIIAVLSAYQDPDGDRSQLRFGVSLSVCLSVIDWPYLFFVSSLFLFFRGILFLAGPSCVKVLVASQSHDQE